jgi:hypothetical protein
LTWSGPATTVGAAALAAAGVVATAGVIADPAYQRTNWRGIDAAVGDSRDRRLLVVSPFNGEVALRAYRPGIEPAHLPQRVREVLVAGAATQVSGDRNAPPRPEPPVLPGFTLVGRDLDSTYTLYRYRAPQRVPVPPGTTVRVQLGDPSSLVIVPPSDRVVER